MGREKAWTRIMAHMWPPNNGNLSSTYWGNDWGRGQGDLSLFWFDHVHIWAFVNHMLLLPNPQLSFPQSRLSHCPSPLNTLSLFFPSHFTTDWWQFNICRNVWCLWSGKKSKSVLDFLTCSRETGFSFSYGEVGNIFRAIVASNEIVRVSKFDNSLSFGAKQNALRHIF